MASVAGRKALVKVPGSALSFTDEATTHAGDGKNYQITNSAKRVWADTGAITVKVGGSVTGEVWTSNRLTGTITFSVTNVGRAAVTVSGNYLPLSAALESKSYSYELRAKNDPDSEFGDTYTSRVQTQKDVGGSLSRWWVDSYFSAALIADTPLVFQFFADSTQAATLTCWGKLSRDSRQHVVDGLSEESLDFSGVIDADSHVTDQDAVTPVVDEIAFLRANISGGDTAMLALYSTNYNVTSSGGFVDSWADARGGGFGPTMSGSSTQRPAWDGATKIITFDGVDDSLTSAASALFDLAGVKSLVLVASMPSTAGATFSAAIGDAGAANRLLGIGQTSTGAGVILSQVNGGGNSAAAQSVVIVSSTQRLVIASKDATTGINIDVPNQSRVSNVNATSVGAGNNALTIGDYWPAAAPGTPHVRAAIVLNRTVTGGDITSLALWAQTYHGVTLA